MSELLRQKKDAFQRVSLERAILEAKEELSRAGLRVLAERAAALSTRLGSAKVRVTSVGAVKSGKSTLVNALLGEDILPRGSGILTALVTRVVTGSAPGARAVFKNEAELNRMLARHLEGLGAARAPEAKPWELTDADDRTEARALALAGAGPHRGSVLALLDGYDTVPWREGAVEGELSELVGYAASEEAAVFVRELTLTVPAIDVPPGLVLMEEMDPVINGISKIGLEVRGMWGEGTEAAGNMFQVSNQITLGRREDEIIAHLEQIVLELIEHENNARTRLMNDKALMVEDHVSRAFGTLSHARLISSGESLNLLSTLRMGLDLGLVSKFSRRELDMLFISIQPAHLQKLEDKVLEPDDRDVVRADMLRNYMKNATEDGSLT